MPVLTGAPSLVIASRVQVYHSCSVDLTWQRAIHSCQRCPRAVLVANTAVTMAPVTQSNVERTHSRFCPAGVHMSTCVPAAELFTSTAKQSASKPQQSNFGPQKGVLSPSGLNLVPSVWGPPNLPAPAASPHHPVHAAHLARASCPSTASPAANHTTAGSSVPNLVSTQRDKVIVPKTADVKVSIDSPSPSETLSSPTEKPEVSVIPETVVTPSVVIVREPQKPVVPNHAPDIQHSDVNLSKIVTSSDRKEVDSNHVGLSEPTTPSSPTSEPEGSADLRPANEASAKKTKKEDSSPSVTKPKVTSPLDTTPLGESLIPTQPGVKTVNIEDDVDKVKTNKSSTRPIDRNGSKPSDTPKSIVVGVQPTQKSTGTIPDSSKDTRESNKFQSETTVNGTVKTGGGGVGDISTSPSKPNRVCVEQTRLGSGEMPVSPSPKPSAPSPLRSPQKSTRVPFHYPLGTTRLSKDDIQVESERANRELNRIVEGLPQECKKTPDPLIPHASFGQVAKALNCPLYWKYLVYSASGGTKEHQPVALSAVLKMWSQVLTSCPDETARFVYMLTNGRSHYLVHSDFSPLIQDILESHPGLAFLQEAKDFHSRYVATVVARILFCVNTSWSGRISLTELRKSNFLSVLASLEQQDDINLVTQYFSYEHFYVIYCKFWELDEDHDLIISRSDLARHNNYAISDRMIERIFSGTVTRGSAFKEGVMTYPDFVWFLLAEEDKRHPRSIEYWFRCMDLDGDGLLSMYEMEYFYSEQVARMEEMGIEPIAFEDCLCQCLDMVNPALGDKIRLSDLKQCRLCHIFFDTFFNLPKYLQHEQRDPFANLRDMEEGLNELSDWDRYAAEAYEMLVNIEGPNQEDGVDEDEAMDEDLEEDGEAGGSPPPTLVVKTDVSSYAKDSVVDAATVNNENNNKPDSNCMDNAPVGLATGTGETTDVTNSPESGRKNKRRRGVLVNGSN
ncbi:hypothetical protein CRM22_002328 [Opisthorchis felineus]|uniref:EF-hand domain-containing protein n=2 Tax=Opisthorchis felineus TaxID=147828 RepID=A0A4S2M6Y7_OPIFE|nr:hypothetical protein CRM22_002328 [Opisthorchis felineus]